MSVALLVMTVYLTRHFAFGAVTVMPSLEERKGVCSTNALQHKLGKMIIVDSNDPIPIDGALVQWEFYVNKGGVVHLQIFRGTPLGLEYRLIGETVYTVESAGYYTGPVFPPIPVEKEDLLGFYSASDKMIPYEQRPCQCERSLRSMVVQSNVSVGHTYRFSIRRSAKKSCRIYGISATVDLLPLAGTYGEAGIKRHNIDEAENLMIIPNTLTLVDSDGRLAGWQINAQRQGVILLQVFRKMPNTSSLIIVDQTRYKVSLTGIHQIELGHHSQFDVQRGDLLGFTTSGRGIIPFDWRDCNGDDTMFAVTAGAVRAGDNFTFHSEEAEQKPCKKYSFTAWIFPEKEAWSRVFIDEGGSGVPSSTIVTSGGGTVLPDIPNLYD